MSYVVLTAVLFAFIEFFQGWRIYEQWTVQIGPHFVSMTVSWIVLVVAALLSPRTHFQKLRFPCALTATGVAVTITPCSVNSSASSAMLMVPQWGLPKLSRVIFRH